jgi:rhodanese-related sulfurtransferase
MKTLLFFLTLVFFVSTASAQLKEYVCTPCGNACDGVVHNKPGVCPSCHMKLVEKKAVLFKNLTVDEFCNRIMAQAILLDVRTPGEFKGDAGAASYGHFKNAININVEELEKRMGELEKYKDREILVYCSHSRRSPRAATMLTDRGFKNVKNLAGGVSVIEAKGNACLEGKFIAHK